MEILTRAGADFTTLGSEEWCCSFPYLGLGLSDEAAKVAEHNVAAMTALGAKIVVATCPSCYHMWRHTYPELLGGAPGVEVLHAAELLVRLLASGAVELAPLGSGQKPAYEVITYHAPRDLGRNSGIYDAPRQLLQAIPGVELVEMVDNRENARWWRRQPGGREPRTRRGHRIAALGSGVGNRRAHACDAMPAVQAHPGECCPSRTESLRPDRAEVWRARQHRPGSR